MTERSKEYGCIRNAQSVTPSDGSDLDPVAVALYIGGAGDVVVDTAVGDTVTFSGAQAGLVIPVSVRRVRSTGTTATNIVALIG